MTIHARPEKSESRVFHFEARMIGTLISILITLVIVGVIWWAAQQLLALIPLAEPIATIVRVVMVVILVLIVLWVIMALLGMGGIHVNTMRLN